MIGRNDNLGAFIMHDLQPSMAQFARWDHISELANHLFNELKAVSYEGHALRAILCLKTECDMKKGEAMDNAIEAIKHVMEADQ